MSVLLSRGAAATLATEIHEAQGLIEGSRMWKSRSGRGSAAHLHTSPSRGTESTGKHVQVPPPAPLLAPTRPLGRRAQAPCKRLLPWPFSNRTVNPSLTPCNKDQNPHERDFFQFPSSSGSLESTSTLNKASWHFPCHHLTTDCCFGSLPASACCCWKLTCAGGPGLDPHWPFQINGLSVTAQSRQGSELRASSQGHILLGFFFKTKR